MVIQHGEYESGTFGGDFAGFFEWGVDVKAREVSENHLFDAHGSACEEDRGCGVVGRTDHGDVRGACGGPYFLADGVTARDDDGVDAFADGNFLDVGAVSDKEDDATVVVALEARDE